MKSFIFDGPLVSVIIPVYNIGGALLGRCLNSILHQSYNNLEVIVVDDCSPNEEDRDTEKKYEKLDGRVHVVRHTTNHGLFAARITGVDASTGDYILFVDSDDYISFDWIRTLLHKALDTKSDIVVGEWCFAYENGVRTYLNLDPFRIKDYEMAQPEAFHTFLKQKDSCFSWQVVWNKLYSSRLWKICLPDFKAYAKKHGRMQMWEDFTFSFDLWMHAEKVSNVHDIYYYYYKHSKAMTCAPRTKEMCISYVNDVRDAFLFADTLLRESKYNSEEYGTLLAGYRDEAIAVIQKDLYSINEAYYSKEVYKAFGKNVSVQVSDFFYGQCTELDGIYDAYENIKKEIIAANTDTVSFDIFDTLLLRPFMYPTDLFEVLSNKLNKETASFIDFASIRRNAEAETRNENRLNKPSCEEVTFDEIYQHIAKTCRFSTHLQEEMKHEELEIEKQVLRRRELGKELFELAKDAGKRIVLISDMYLSGAFIREVLQKNGYSGYHKLYISSEILLTKATGNLYKYVLKDLGIKNAKTMLHLGDNWHSDVEMPKTLGIRAEHLPKGSDLYLKWSSIWGGDAFYRTFRTSGMTEDYGMLFDSSPSLRSPLAVACNKIFDNPFISFNRDSDYNDDPRYIGYYALGGMVLAIAQWIKEQAVEYQIPCIHFVARDGWLVKKVFDIINDTPTTSDYIRLSRKALVLCDVNTVDDIYSLNRKLNPMVSTPENVYQYLEPALVIQEERLWQMATARGFYRDRQFHSIDEYEGFLSLLIEEAFSIEKLDEYKGKLKHYFAKIIHQGEFIFDVGYSGRPEAALSNLLGYPVGSLYLHTNGDGFAENRHRKYDIKCHCFYNIKPVITGAIREHCLMEQGPSTIGYDLSGGDAKPIFEKFEVDYAEELITEVLQHSALQFVQDFSDLLGPYREFVYCNNTALAAPYEMYLHFPKEFDKYLFKAISFEDNLNVGKDYSLFDFWNVELSRAQLHNRIHERELEGMLWDAQRRADEAYNSRSYKLGHLIVKGPGMLLRKIGVIKD